MDYASKSAYRRHWIHRTPHITFNSIRKNAWLGAITFCGMMAAAQGLINLNEARLIEAETSAKLEQVAAHQARQLLRYHQSVHIQLTPDRTGYVCRLPVAKTWELVAAHNCERWGTEMQSLMMVARE